MRKIGYSRAIAIRGIYAFEHKAVADSQPLVWWLSAELIPAAGVEPLVEMGQTDEAAEGRIRYLRQAGQSCGRQLRSGFSSVLHGRQQLGKTVKVSLSTGTSCGTRRFTGQLLHIDEGTSRNVGAKVRAGINNRRGDGRALGQSQADWQNKCKEAGKAAQVWNRSCGELCVHGFSESLSCHGLAVKITFFFLLRVDHRIVADDSVNR